MDNELFEWEWDHRLDRPDLTDQTWQTWLDRSDLTGLTWQVWLDRSDFVRPDLRLLVIVLMVVIASPLPMCGANCFSLSQGVANKRQGLPLFIVTRSLQSFKWSFGICCHWQHHAPWNNFNNYYYIPGSNKQIYFALKCDLWLITTFEIHHKFVNDHVICWS